MALTRKRFGVAALLLILLAVVLLMWPRGRGTPFDDSDLMPTDGAVAKGDDAFWLLESTAEKIVWPKDRESEISKLITGEKWDAQLATEFLAENENALALFEKALAMPTLRIPALDSFDQNFPYLGYWKSLAQLAAVQSASLFREGKPREAYDAAMRIVHFGHQIENCGGALIHYLVGTAIKEIGLKRIRLMTTTTTLSRGELVSCLRRLDAYRANEAGLSNAFKVEYRLSAKSFENLSMGQLPGTNTPMAQLAFSVGTKPMLNIRKTKARLATACRICLRSIPQPLAKMPLNEMPRINRNASKIGRLLRGNAVGEMLVDMLWPAWEKNTGKKCRENANVTATQLLLALKCYQIEHGKLPESLGELVPGYFPSVPLDDFDGKPFRYSRDRKLLYSVGEDLVDSGGQAPVGNKKALDIIFPIDF